MIEPMDIVPPPHKPQCAGAEWARFEDGGWAPVDMQCPGCRWLREIEQDARAFMAFVALFEGVTFAPFTQPGPQQPTG